MSLSRNAAYTAVGAALPSLLTLVTVPLYLHVVGIERYGVLALCWVFLSYSNFMDFGLGLAVNHRIAKSREGEEEEAAKAFWTAVWLSLAAGSIAAIGIYAAGAYYFGTMAKVAPTFRGEVADAIPLLAAMVPVVMLSGVLGGALQGRERFLAFNVGGALGNTLLAVLPLLLAYMWTPVLPVLLLGAVAARLAPLPWLYHVCRRAIPLRGVRRPSLATAKSLLGFGGWVSLTTIANTVLGSADRLTIGSAVGAAAVSIYTIPFNLVSRVTIMPHALGLALFPRFASLPRQERDELVLGSIQTVTAITTPLFVGLVILLDPFLTIWIGARLTQPALPLAYMFAIGFWFYCVGYPAMSALQATGRPDLVSKVLVVEILPYIGALVFAVTRFGLPGAALVFALRSVGEALAMLVLARIPVSALRLLLLPGGLILAAVAIAYALQGPTEYAVLAALLIVTLWWSVDHAPAFVRDRLTGFVAFLPGLRRRP